MNQFLIIVRGSDHATVSPEKMQQRLAAFGEGVNCGLKRWGRERMISTLVSLDDACRRRPNAGVSNSGCRNDRSSSSIKYVVVFLAASIIDWPMTHPR